MAQPLVVRIEDRLELWGNPGPQELPKFKGFAVDPDGFEGIDDGVDMRRDSVERPQAHGDFELPGFLASRVSSLSGWCRADSHAELLHFRSILTGILGHGGTGKLVARWGGDPRWGMAGRAGPAPKFKVRAKTPRIADWQLQLWFPDPRLYGETRVFAAGELAHHYGNFPAAPVFTVSGSMPSGYTINGPAGKKYIVTRAVTSGAPHTIDMATGLLSVGGAVVFGAVSRADTWGVPGGAQVAHTLVPVSGSGSVSVAVRDTFI